MKLAITLGLFLAFVGLSQASPKLLKPGLESLKKVLKENGYGDVDQLKQQAHPNLRHDLPVVEI